MSKFLSISYFKVKASALVLVVSLLFLSFHPSPINNSDPGTKYEKILRNVGLLLEQGHYRPKKIDDSFSKEVLESFLKSLDDDKTVFLQNDIDGFKKFETVIDDEIYGKAKIESFFTIIDVYNKRLEEASKLYEPLLSAPFDYTIEESVILDGDKREYPKTEAERKEAWRLKLKYLALTKYVDLLNEIESGKKSISSTASLPGITSIRRKNKTEVSVEHTFSKKVNNINIQRSLDSNKNFTTISVFYSPDGKKKIFVDSSSSNAKYYYRAFVAFEDGSYQVGKPVIPTTDEISIEFDARDKAKKQIGRYLTTLKNHNTTDELFSTFVNAITSTMDPHSDYFAPIDQRSFNEAMSGSFYGIGAQLRDDEGKIKIASLVTGSPAWKSGEIVVNDEILKIGEGKKEPVDVTGYAISDAVKLIRGAQKGTEIRLTLKKADGSIKVVSLLRDEIKLDDTFARSAIIKGEKKIGYIYLPEFYIDFQKINGARCSEDVAKEIEKLKEEKVEGIVMDLRGNGGGSLPEVVKMVGLFIEDGPVCQVKGRDEKQPYLWRDKDKSVLYDGPLTVMVDENSASASEIFAAAIQDYKRGIVIGSSSTFGKGTVQRSIPLSPESDNGLFNKSSEEDLGTVKLTLQKFYRINGGSTQLKGVTPDIILPHINELSKNREKDYPTALSWDEIPNADFKAWNAGISTDLIINQAKQEVASQSIFTQYRKNIEWLKDENDKSYSLNLEAYRAELKKQKSVYKELDSLTKLPKEMIVINTQKDELKITGDKEKKEKNKLFIDRIKKDIYINETVQVLNKIISETVLAKKN